MRTKIPSKEKNKIIMAERPPYFLLPKPMFVEWNELMCAFYLGDEVRFGMPLVHRETLELQQLKTEMDLLGGSNLDLRKVSIDKRTHFKNEISRLLEERKLPCQRVSTPTFVRSL